VSLRHLYIEFNSERQQWSSHLRLLYIEFKNYSSWVSSKRGANSSVNPSIDK
jgi:hypothetical protein